MAKSSRTILNDHVCMLITTTIALRVGLSIHTELEESPEGGDVGQVRKRREDEEAQDGHPSNECQETLDNNEQDNLPEVLVDDSATVPDSITESQIFVFYCE